MTGAIGKDKVGIRLSRFGVFNDMPAYPAMEADYTCLAPELNALGPVYIHRVDHSPMGAPPVPESMQAAFRSVFRRVLIHSGGHNVALAESNLATGKCDLVAVGRPFLANPDLVARWKSSAAVNAPNTSSRRTGTATMMSPSRNANGSKRTNSKSARRAKKPGTASRLRRCSNP